MMTTVTLRLPAKLNRRIARAARQKGQSPTCWMLAALEHEVERKERFFDYVKQARRAATEAGRVEELESRIRARFWLGQFCAGKAVTRSHARRAN